MASYGPYPSVDPDALLDKYRDLDRSPEQLAALERSLEQYPRVREDNA